MQKEIKVLGTGCPKCKTTMALVNDVVAENNMDAKIEKVEDIMEIMKYDVMSTPAIVVNNKVVVTGRVPSKSELLDILNSSS